MPAEPFFPLRWESTGDQWWYASPIDWAAANGHYDLVRELLHLDTNLLIKLTSLRRIRRLEVVWDDDERFTNAAQNRAFVARNLLLECETKNGQNTLIRAGYGGWLLYTAASAGDISFVKELLGRDPLMVFGEAEYGVTDIFYAAARSKNCAVFRVLFDFAVERNCSSSGGESTFRWEMVNRALHAAARGGNLEILKELLSDCSDVLAYRDVQGSTVLHAAAGRGQVEVVKHLVASFDIINCRDNNGNTALHVAAFRGHLVVIETLFITSPSCSYQTNNAGDTFLHMAVAGFRTPGFRRLDRQMDLMKRLINGNMVNVRELINHKNKEGRTILHMAVIGNMHSDLVEILMTVKSINLNIRDVDGLTPLDHLRHRPRDPCSEILIRQLISAGGISNSKDYKARSAIVSQLRMHGIGSSPGTSFRISDAEIFLYTGIEATEITTMDRGSGRPSSCSSSAHLETIDENHQDYTDSKKQNSVNRAAARLKILLRWPVHKDKKLETPKKINKDDSVGSMKRPNDREDTPTPLRERFVRGPSLPNNKRTLSVRPSLPSPSAKKKFTAGLTQGVIQAMPHLAPPSRCSTANRESDSDCKLGDMCLEDEDAITSTKSQHNKSGFMNTKRMNHYFCFGAQGLTTENSVNGVQATRLFKRSVLSTA